MGRESADVILARLLRERGSDLSRSRERCRAILSDAFGARGRKGRQEVGLLIAAVDAGAALGPDRGRDTLIATLTHEHGLSSDDARWAVDTWQSAQTRVAEGEPEPGAASVLTPPPHRGRRWGAASTLLLVGGLSAASWVVANRYYGTEKRPPSSPSRSSSKATEAAPTTQPTPTTEPVPTTESVPATEPTADTMPTPTTNPTPTTTATALNFKVINTCELGPQCKINVFAGPGVTNYAKAGGLDESTVVEVACQKRGEAIQRPNGSRTDIWDKLADGRWIVNAYLDTRADGFDPRLPQCG